MSEVKSFYESIIVLDNIKENNPRYVEFTANNSGNPFIMESSVSNNEENHDGQHPVLLSDTGLGDEPKVEQETTSLNSLNSVSNFHIQGWIQEKAYGPMKYNTIVFNASLKYKYFINTKIVIFLSYL